jgi:hypothetical protein
MTSRLVRTLPLAALRGVLGCAGTANTRRQILVPRPRGEAFAYLAAFEHMPRWNSVTELVPGERIAVDTLPPSPNRSA